MNSITNINDITDINEIKMAVLKKTAEYAFNGTIMDKFDEIPSELIVGIKPKFRCCVYREREIIRQRVRLSMGKMPSNSTLKKGDDAQVVHVISSACEGCPIARFTVTDNCHSCLAQKCIKACKFNAITKTPKGAYIDSTKCKKCGACEKACPYNAIVDIERPCIKTCPVDAISIDENDLAYIDETKCINCGKCVVGCPFGAVSDISMITNVINELTNEGNHLYAMLAPSVEGQFGDYTMSVLKAGIKSLGFKDCLEVALGADAVAYEETKEVVENIKNGKKTTTSCCPAFVSLIQKHYPALEENISTTVSPMIATARYIRSFDPEAKVVFIGPCIAKKYEAVKNYVGEINMVLTVEEVQAMLEVKEIDLSKFTGDTEVSTKYGKGFAKSGGVTESVLKVAKEMEIAMEVKALKCDGIAECKKALFMLKSGKLKEDFIEGMSCEGGCVNGPAKITELNYNKKIFDKYANVPNDEIIKTCNENNLDKINIHKHN